MASRDKSGPQLTLDLPAEVRRCVDRLRAVGGEVWLVGGAVRDGLLGLPVVDFDLATTVAPPRLLELFPEAREADARLGSCRIELTEGAVVITTLRVESDYTDFRHPERVSFVTDVARDARRRDFTVNAIYADPDDGTLLDPEAGLPDLAARRLATIGAAEVRLREDPLRMLRAVRFSGRLSLHLDPALHKVLQAGAPLLRHLSAERVFAELTAMFTGAGRGEALRSLVHTGLAAVVLPEVVPMAGVPQPPEFHPEGDVLTHVCLVLDQVPAGVPVLAWAAVLHDVGKPGTFRRAEDRIRFDGHDVLSARMADAALLRLRAPGELRRTVVEVCRDHIRFVSLSAMRRAKRERWLRSPRFPVHLEFHRADCLGSHGDLSCYELAARALGELPPEPRPPLCSGRDVLALGVPAGPIVGELLRALEVELDAEGEPDRGTALAILDRLAAPHVKARR